MQEPQRNTSTDVLLSIRRRRRRRRLQHVQYKIYTHDCIAYSTYTIDSSSQYTIHYPVLQYTTHVRRVHVRVYPLPFSLYRVNFNHLRYVCVFDFIHAIPDNEEQSCISFTRLGHPCAEYALDRCTYPAEQHTGTMLGPPLLDVRPVHGF